MALFPGPPGWAGARRELRNFMVQGKINRGNAHLRHPIFYRPDAFLPPNQQCQSTEGN